MPKEKIISVIDIGSNSVVLLTARCHNRTIDPINEVYANTGLGEGVTRDGMLSAEAMRRTISVLREMKAISEREGSEDLIVTAASAVRNALNKSEFLVKCHTELNIFPQVLNGKEEARFTYLGATSDIAEDGPLFTIEIGGGSTQIAYGTKDIMIQAHNLEIGSIGVADRFSIGKGAWIHNWIAAKMEIKKSLFSVVDEINSWLTTRRPIVIASGGTAVAYAEILLKNSIYDRRQINATRSTAKEVSAIGRMLARISKEDRIRKYAVEKNRADVLPAGLLILASILKFFNFDEFRICANGMRFGILRHYM